MFFLSFTSFSRASWFLLFDSGKSRQHSDFGFFLIHIFIFIFHVHFAVIFICVHASKSSKIFYVVFRTRFIFSRSIKVLNVITSFFFLSLFRPHPGENHGCVMKAQQQFFFSGDNIDWHNKYFDLRQFHTFHPSQRLPQWIIWV